jgi:hypothetical protein
MRVTDIPEHLRRTRINSSKLVIAKGEKEIYTSNLNSGEVKVHRTGLVNVTDELKDFEGLDTTDMKIQGLNL